MKNDYRSNPNNHRIRVLMITCEWPRPPINLTAHFIKRQADFLVAAGVDVDVFAFKGAKNPFKYFHAWWRLRRQLRRKTYDVVHAQFGQSGLLALPKQLPLVVTFRGSDLLGTLSDRTRRYMRASALHKRLSRFVAKRADAVIVVAEHMKRNLPPSLEPHVVPSGIDFNVFKPMDKREARAALGLPLHEKLVLFVGRTNHARKRGYLAEQAIELLDKSLRAKLIVAWRVSHNEVPLYMNACDALVFTSRQEGSPNVVKEALACNLPVVSVRVGDVADRIKNIEGCELCEDDSPAAIATALARALRRGKRVAGRDAVASLDENVTTRRVISIYKSVIEGGKASVEVNALTRPQTD